MWTLEEKIFCQVTLVGRHVHKVWPNHLILRSRMYDSRSRLLIHIEVLGIDIIVLSNVIASVIVRRDRHLYHVHHSLEGLRVRSSLLLILK
jgi:hypothetical protein